MKILFLSIFFLFALNMQAATFIAYEYNGEVYWFVSEHDFDCESIMGSEPVTGVTITGCEQFDNNNYPPPPPRNSTQVSADQALKDLGIDSFADL